MNDFKIAAQLYTVRELLQDKSKDEIYSVLKQIKDIGYSCVQISGVGDVTKEVAEIYRDVCSELKLDICATHLSLETLQNDFDWVVEYHKMWNCNYAGIGIMPEDYRRFERLDEFILECNKYGKMLAKQEITLVYHNHKLEFEKQGDNTMMDIMLDKFNDNVEFELDTYWVQAGGCNPVNWIYKIDGRMSVVHFKDFRIVIDEQQFAEIGQGNLDWDGIIKACSETGVKYAAVEQDSFTDHPIDSLKMSYDYLRRKLHCDS